MQDYYSTNAAGTFAHVAMPPGKTAGHFLTVPGKAGTFVIDALCVGGTEIYVTPDFGATWVALPLPPTTITDVSGIVVDAAATLFLVREGTLFSHAL